MNPAHRALLARLREIVIEVPKSGALNKGKRPLYVRRFEDAVERRAEDGPALVAYVRDKVYEPATDSYGALVEAGRSDLAVEALVADADAPWASLFSDEDRDAARTRLGPQIERYEAKLAADEAVAVEHDHKIVADVNASRIAKGKARLTPEQEADMLGRLAAKRVAR
jgi:hypothetical protein